MKNFDDTPLEFPKGRNEIYIGKTRQYSTVRNLFNVYREKDGTKDFGDFTKYKLNHEGKLSVRIPTDSQHFNIHVSID